MSEFKNLWPWQRGYFRQQVGIWGFWPAVVEMTFLALYVAAALAYFVFAWNFLTEVR